MPSRLPCRRRVSVRTRIYEVAPDSDVGLMDEALCERVLGVSHTKVAENETIHVAIHIPSLEGPSTSSRTDSESSAEPAPTPRLSWNILKVRLVPSPDGSKTPPAKPSAIVGSIGVPAGLFPGIGTGSTFGNSQTQHRPVKTGIVGSVRAVDVLNLSRVVVCVQHPIPAGEHPPDDDTPPGNAAETYVEPVQSALRTTGIVRERGRLLLESGLSATVELAEPVSQGAISNETQIVVRLERAAPQAPRKPRVQTSQAKTITFNAIQEESEVDYASGGDDGSEGLTDLSDDDSVMTLAPATSVLTGLSLGTGVATPGSMMSTFTSSQPKSAIFGVRVLTQPIVQDAIVPPPGDDDTDDGARVFARASSLVKVGVLSGDWVWIENSSLLSFGIESAEQAQEGRAVRIYAAPGMQNYVSGSSSSEDLILPPVLFGNLGRPASIRVCRHMIGPRRVRVTAIPPIASEVRLVRIASQLGLEKRAQTAVVAGVKRYFAGRRLVSEGDLVPILITLGEGDEIEESVAKGRGERDVVWFMVAGVDVGENQDELSKDPESSLRNWGCAVVDPAETTLVQAGAEQRRVLGGREWREYVGIPGGSLSVFSDPSGSPERSGVLGRLISLFSVAAHPSQLTPAARILLTGKRASGKVWNVQAAAAAIGMHVFEIDCWDVLANDRDVQIEAVLRARVERAVAMGDTSVHNGTCTVVLLRNINVLGHLPLKSILKPARLVVGTASPDASEVDDQIRAIFSHELEVSVPGESEREAILRDLVTSRGLECGRDVKLSEVSRKTAALVAGDLVDLVSRAEVFRQRRVHGAIQKLNPNVQQLDIVAAGGDLCRLMKADFDAAADAARKNFADAIGAPKIPAVSWNDVGGLAHVRAAVTETIQLPLARPELFASGLKKRSGILFYGPPGTGKTLVAKAIATEYGLNFFSVKGPELLNMYIGESEANVRRVFQRARDARPCVVFFDELDSVAPKRGNQGDSGGVMDRIVAQLLAELDGMSGGGGSGNGGSGGGAAGAANSAPSADAGGVFVVGATNRPDLLDQALLRPGRFDKIVYLGLPDTVEKRVNVMQALTRKFTLDDDVDFASVVRDGGLTGADLYALCADAMLAAVGRGVEGVKTKIAEIESQGEREGGPDRPRPATGKLTTAQYFDHYATADDLAVVVCQADFVKARRELVPSVSAEELQHYERVRDLFEGKDKGKSTAVEVGLVPGSGPGERESTPPPTNASMAALSLGSGKRSVRRVAGRQSLGTITGNDSIFSGEDGNEKDKDRPERPEKPARLDNFGAGGVEREGRGDGEDGENEKPTAGSQDDALYDDGVPLS